MLFFFFFKQRTSYEMRISDWSSDVCSSDLALLDSEISCRLPNLSPRPSERQRARAGAHGSDTLRPRPHLAPLHVVLGTLDRAPIENSRAGPGARPVYGSRLALALLAWPG